MIKIKTPQGEATIQDGVWSAQDPRLARALNSVQYDLLIEGYSPYPDLAMAQVAIEITSGELLDVDEPPPLEEGEVY